MRRAAGLAEEEAAGRPGRSEGKENSNSADGRRPRAVRLSSSCGSSFSHVPSPGKAKLHRRQSPGKARTGLLALHLALLSAYISALGSEDSPHVHENADVPQALPRRVSGGSIRGGPAGRSGDGAASDGTGVPRRDASVVCAGGQACCAGSGYGFRREDGREPQSAAGRSVFPALLRPQLRPAGAAPAALAGVRRHRRRFGPGGHQQSRHRRRRPGEGHAWGSPRIRCRGGPERSAYRPGGDAGEGPQGAVPRSRVRQFRRA